MFKNKKLSITCIAAFLLLVTVLLMAWTRPRAMFEIDPTSGCADAAERGLQVTWDVTPLGLDGALITIKNLAEPEKLWAQVGGVGSEQTGNWATDGFTLILRTLQGAELARRTYVTMECPQD